MERIVKHLKNNYKIIIGIIIGVVISGCGVYAAGVIASKEITYKDNTGIGATNVQDAIDKLYAKADNQYFDLATAKASKGGKVFASKKGVCISRNKTVYCFKIKNYNVEKEHIKQVFSDVSCDVGSSNVGCSASDFYCDVYLYGGVDCYATSDDSGCYVSASGGVDCDASE